MKLVRIVLCAASLLAFPRVTSAWNDTGHMTVALVAWRQLDDAQRQQIGKILRAHPHYERFLLLDKPDNVPAEEWAFLKAATWPDFVRPARPGSFGEVFKGPEVTRYHRSPWHYVEVPWVHPLDRKTIDPTTMPSRIAAKRPSTNPDDPRDIMEALEFNAKRLSGAATSNEDRAVALAWMEHLVGDLHQPLHACTVYSRDFPVGDRGGNDEAVRCNDIVQRLHAFWDGALGTSEAYVMIDLLASDLLATPQLDPGKLPELRRPTTYSDWAAESHEYAIGVAHLNGYLRSARYAAYDAKEIGVDGVPPVPESYYANTRELSKRRIATAGYRLAERVKALVPN